MSYYNLHPYASVGCRSLAPTKRQVRARSGKSGRNQAGWRHMADSSRYAFPVVTRHV